MNFKKEMNQQLKDGIWDIIESYFEGRHLERLVSHQIESYNNFVSFQILRTIEMFNPVVIVSEQDLDPVSKKYSLEIVINFENFQIYRPQIHENNGSIKLMFPQEARLRNFTYASAMTIDMNIKYIIRNGENLENTQIIQKLLPNIHIGKLPIMLKSNICVLNQYKHVDNSHTGECKYDAGGYFIINGSEKTVLAQERAAENKIYCYNIHKNNPKYTWMVEIKSIPDNKCISPKQINMMILSKNNGFGYPIVLQLPRVKQPLPLFVVFRALGVLSDKEICEKILLNIDFPLYKDMLESLQASIIEANNFLTQEDAIQMIQSYVIYTPINMDKETGMKKKYKFTLDILSNDLFPHCNTTEKKIYFLGYMTFKLLQVSSGWIKGDDRDSYINKRVDSTGVLLNNLFRNYFNKLVKDMEKQVIREMVNGSWKSTDDYGNIINLTNIYKIIKSTTIENGLKRALATGDFGIKHINNNKVGVAQVLNRLTYMASLSHLRRIATPTDKSGKLIPPRKLHNTSWGFLCPAETPEGQSVGIIKNLSYLSHLTIYSNSTPIYEYVEKFIQDIDTLSPIDLFDKVKVIINGNWIGITESPVELYMDLKKKKYEGMINIYTSIIFDTKCKEIRVCNDSGRITRPLFKSMNKKILLTSEILEKIKNKELIWEDLLTNLKIEESVIEYIDPEEQNYSMIATKMNELDTTMYKYNFCEIHPSTIFGILASCIPFPEHNQSPRNTYQCAMGKQAMGVYVSNYMERMDKTSYVLINPTRSLVDTRIMNIIKLNEIPSGCNIIVAIMTHTGYNQEDSLLVNKGSIDRGMFMATIYHTEKDEDKQKINGDEEIRCKPEPSKTKGMKFGNYNKVNSKGIVPENTRIENRDIIIAKVMPIKENRNDPTKVIKFEDQSKIYRTTEEVYIDKNYIERNGDGYSFAKVRLRALRKPVIGDKFCALPTQQVLTNKGWVEIKDIDITEHQLITLDTNGKMCYEFPTAKYEYDHEGEMYSIKNKQVEIVCTLNHKLYVKKRSGKKYELIEAKDIMGKMVRFEKTMENVYPDVETITFGEETYDMDAWLQLLGMFISDGWSDKTNKKIIITALKERKREFINKLLEKLMIESSYHEDGNYYISGSKYSEIYTQLKELSVGALNKYLPEYVWNLSKRQSIVLLESLLEGDGSRMVYKEETFDRYGTISLKLANDITRLALYCGWSGIVKIAEEPTGIARVGKRNLGTRAGQEVSITQKHTYYKVSIIRKQNQPWINKKVNGSNEEKLIHYTGKVYCVEMPSSHTYYMRETNFSPCLIVGNSSKHGQKGTVGNIIPEKDMPFTKDGIRPDIIINPHAIPSRMTIGQLKETLLGKVLIQLGLFGDGTSFGEMDVNYISNELLKVGFEKNGNELMYNGLTGEQLECNIFIGPVNYQRLKHMVNDKQHSRSIGPMVNLTRQPAEGRSRDGGLRFGEMERDCLSENTKISLSNGLSVSIKDMEDCDNEVLGFNEKTNNIVPAKQIGFLYKGERECIQLTMEDGRTNICTPDHPLLNSRNEWVKAKDFKVNEDKVKCSVRCPTVNYKEEMEECKGWELQVGELIFKTDTKDNYLKSLIFAKMLGYIITDGTISTKDNKIQNCRIFLGHMIDVRSFVKDLSKLCEVKQTQFKTSNLYCVRLPNILSKHIIKLPGILCNKRSCQVACLPDFILDPACPKPIVREFLGGLFGGDGHTCILGLHRGKRDVLTSVSFSQTKQEPHLESLTKMMEDIKTLFQRFDIHKVTIQKLKETTHSKKHQTVKSYQSTLHLDIDELIPFAEKIGFRYCCHKSQRLDAAVSYKELRNHVVRQHNWIVQRVDEITNFSEIKKENPNKIVATKKAITQAVDELKEREPLIHSYAIPSTHDITVHLIKGTQFGKFTSKSFPNANQYLEEIGALEWFLNDEIMKKEREEEEENSSYGVKRLDEGLPTMNLRVIDIRPVGLQKVYDIEVEEIHNFLANGVVAHNCMISHGASKFTQDRIYYSSDKYQVYCCNCCGLIASYNDELHIHICKTCDNRTDFSLLNIPYSCKLLFQELITMNVAPRFITNH